MRTQIKRRSNTEKAVVCPSVYKVFCVVFIPLAVQPLFCNYSQVFSAHHVSKATGKHPPNLSITFHLVNLLLFVICSISQVPSQKVHGA